MGRQKFCSACAPTNSKEALVEAARKGRIAAQTPQALSRLAETQRSHRLAERAWKPEDKPDWLDDKAYAQEIHPRLADMTISTIALTLRVSLPYASDNLPTRAGVWGFQEAPQPESVVCKCLTSENSHVPTWGSTLFAALSLQKTTTALKRPHTRARAGLLGEPPSRGPQLPLGVNASRGACAVQGSSIPPFNYKTQARD